MGAVDHVAAEVGWDVICLGCFVLVFDTRGSNGSHIRPSQPPLEVVIASETSS